MQIKTGRYRTYAFQKAPQLKKLRSKYLIIDVYLDKPHRAWKNPHSADSVRFSPQLPILWKLWYNNRVISKKEVRFPLELFASYMLTVSKCVMILLSVLLMVRCIRSMLRENYEPETWAYLRVGR